MTSSDSYSLGNLESFHYLSNLNFTIGHAWRNSTANFSADYDASGFENDLLNMCALFGVFDAMTYRDWRSWYAVRLADYNVNITNISGLGYDPSIWMCDRNYSRLCTKEAALQNASDWKVTLGNIPIDHCLSKKTGTAGEMCRLEFSSMIFAIILGCDTIKIVVIVLALCTIEEQPLVTTGDAVTAFLKSPENYTEGRCLVDQERSVLESNFFWFLSSDFTRVVGDDTVAKIWPAHFGPQRTAWEVRKKKWYHAPSQERWMSFFLL